MMRLAHFCGGFRGLGGVESVLHRHWTEDAHWGLESSFLVYFEKADAPQERVHFLDFGPGTTIRQTRQRIAGALGTRRPDVGVYHGFWGLPYFADLDGASRRLLFLHGDVPGFAEQLCSRAPFVDGVLCVSRPLEATIHQLLPALGPERVRFIPYPVFPPATSATSTPSTDSNASTASIASPRPNRDRATDPIVIGICGRIIREQKRVDRVPALLRQLDAAGLNYRLEFLGDGPERPWLEQAVAGNPRVRFHGRRSGADYWRLLAAWDVILFVSDYEGTPIALIEALTQGVVPIHPRIQSGGDAYAAAVRADLVYAPDDFGHVVRTLTALSTLDPAAAAALRQRCVSVVAPHTGENYHRTFAEFVAEIRHRPRVGTASFPRRPFPVDHLSFTWLERLSRARRWVRQRGRRPAGGGVRA